MSVSRFGLSPRLLMDDVVVILMLAALVAVC